MTRNDFQVQFAPLSDGLRLYAFNLTQDKNDASDLYQEMAFKAFANFKQFRENTNLKAWLMTIMKNIFINNYRRKKRQNTISDATNGEYYINSSSQVARNDGEGNILIEELKKMIQELDESLKIPFLMHYQGFKYQEIADKLELPIGTIKSRIFFARNILKQKINQRYDAQSSYALAS